MHAQVFPVGLTVMVPRGCGTGEVTGLLSGLREAMTTETDVQNAIRLAVGSLPYVRLFRNNVGEAKFYDGASKRMRSVVYGLAPGSADLIGIIAPAGTFLSIEVKKPGGRTAPKRAESQRIWREMVTRFGGLAIQVDNVADALAAVERAQRGEML
jgi:hypothetical protein